MPPKNGAAEAATTDETKTDAPAPEAAADEAAATVETGGVVGEAGAEVPVAEAAPAEGDDGGNVEDIDHEGDPDVVSASPPRPHDAIVSALKLRHAELLDFTRNLEGDCEGEIGELLTLLRSHHATRAAQRAE